MQNDNQYSPSAIQQALSAFQTFGSNIARGIGQGLNNAAQSWEQSFQQPVGGLAGQAIQSFTPPPPAPPQNTFANFAPTYQQATQAATQPYTPPAPSFGQQIAASWKPMINYSYGPQGKVAGGIVGAGIQTLLGGGDLKTQNIMQQSNAIMNSLKAQNPGMTFFPDSQTGKMSAVPNLLSPQTIDLSTKLTPQQQQFLDQRAQIETQKMQGLAMGAVTEGMGKVSPLQREAGGAVEGQIVEPAQIQAPQQALIEQPPREPAQDIQKTAPDLVTPEAQQQLTEQYQKAFENKPAFDNFLRQTAQETGAWGETNFKNPDTKILKIVAKRSEGRNYDIDTGNDDLRGRLILPDEKSIYQAVDLINQNAPQAGWKVGKEQDYFKHPDENGYQAYHIDLIAPNGQTVEIQLHTEQSLAAALATHDVRATWGENMPKEIAKQMSATNHEIQDMSNAQARAISDQIRAKTAPKMAEAQSNAVAVAQGQPAPIIQKTTQTNLLYHASPVKAIKQFKASVDGVMGKGVYLHENPNVAMEASAMQGDGNLADIRTYTAQLSTNKIYQANASYPTPEEITAIKKVGYDGIRTPGGEVIVFDPKNVSIIQEQLPPQEKLTKEEAGKTFPIGPGGGTTGNRPPQEPVADYMSRTKKQIQNDFRAAAARMQAGKYLNQQDYKPNMDFFSKLSKKDHLDFLQRAETGQPQPTPELQAQADWLKAQRDIDYSIVGTIKDVPYNADSFARSGLWDNKDQATVFFNRWMKNQNLQGHVDALHGRVFPTVYDGIAAGLKLKETNPAVLAFNSRVQTLKLKMATDFMTEQEAKGAEPNLVQSIIQQYLDPGLSKYGVFRGLRGLVNAQNQLNLLGGFHFTTTAINAQISKLGLGLQQASWGVKDLLALHPVSAAQKFVSATSSIIRAPFAPFEYAFKGFQLGRKFEKGLLDDPDIANILEGGGRFKMPENYGVGWNNAVYEFKKGTLGGIIKGTAKMPFTLLDWIGKPLMDYWVPAIKEGAANDLIKNTVDALGPDATADEIRAAKALAIDSIDNRFGQLNQDNLFWNNAIKDFLGLLMRSPGWNIGTVRELGGGVIDLVDLRNFYKTGGLTDRAAYLLALPIVIGVLGAIYMYLKTGKGPEQPVDYFYPKTGETDPRTGKEERVALPSYAKDIVSFFKDPIQTIQNKESGLLAQMLSLYSNQDYLGKPIRDVRADLATQAKQTLAYEIQQNIPFTLTTMTKRLNPNAETLAESLAGITKAPQSVTGGYYPAKAEEDAKLTSHQLDIATYLDTPVSQGGPSSQEKAKMYMDQVDKEGNYWLLNRERNMQLASDPNNPLWKLPLDALKVVFAEEATTNSSQKAALRLKLAQDYGIQFSSLMDSYNKYVKNSIAQTQAARTTQQQSLPYQLSYGMLGVTPPDQTQTTTNYVQRPPTPYSQLSARFQALVDAHTAAPVGSPARRQLAQQINAQIPGYFAANAAYYQQNPVTDTSPLGKYLTSIGINPNTATGGTGGRSSYIRMPSTARNAFNRMVQSRPKGPSVKKLSTKGKGGIKALSLGSSQTFKPITLASKSYATKGLNFRTFPTSSRGFSRLSAPKFAKLRMPINSRKRYPVRLGGQYA